MSFIERVFHAILFEVLAILLSLIIIRFFTEHSVFLLSSLLILISVVAVIWNFIFNLVFDKYFTGRRENRSLKLRILHSLCFEFGLLIFTLPMIMQMLDVSFIKALYMDIGMTFFILFYTIVFNIIYDRMPLYFIK